METFPLILAGLTQARRANHLPQHRVQRQQERMRQRQPRGIVREQAEHVPMLDLSGLRRKGLRGGSARRDVCLLLWTRRKPREAETQVVWAVLPLEADVEVARGLRVEVAGGTRDQVEDALVEELVHHASEDEAVGCGVGIGAADDAVQAISQFGAEAESDEQPERCSRLLQRSDGVWNQVGRLEAYIRLGREGTTLVLALETGAEVFGGAAGRLLASFAVGRRGSVRKRRDIEVLENVAVAGIQHGIFEPRFGGVGDGIFNRISADGAAADGLAGPAPAPGVQQAVSEDFSQPLDVVWVQRKYPADEGGHGSGAIRGWSDGHVSEDGKEN